MAPPRRGETRRAKMQNARGKHVQKVQKQQSSEDHAQVLALSKAQPISYYDMDGWVLDVNANFEAMVGYSRAELVGKHVSIFVDEATRRSQEYKTSVQVIWEKLRHGEDCWGEAQRATKQGKEFWVEYSYSPLLDENGKAYKVVGVLREITERTLANADLRGQIAAIAKAQAVIEFNMDGTVLAANDNFLKALGYTLDEIKAKHHSMFVDEAYKQSPGYKEFWAKLNRGEYDAAEYKRIGKGGREVWIQASYNPIFDLNGKPFKVVKYATDVTAQKLINADYQGQIAAIAKAQAVIEFNMDGTVLAANDNFLKALGYTLDEIKGKHHSMFIEEAYRQSADYAEFWAKLRRGESQAAEYKRIGKVEQEVFIQASYHPILDLNGKPFKVVKYATDLTGQVLVRMGNERVRGMMESVAAGSEELNASVREISEAMTKSRDTAMSAVDQVAAADAQAQRLTEAALAMSGIVELINNITGQINLLALNATIESARAGEAGRGFAVVASEVKSLANQAKQATDKIGAEIGSLNGISGDVVTALASIKTAINNVSEYVTSTAAAIEEQSTVTNEMSTSMQRAAAEAAAMAASA